MKEIVQVKLENEMDIILAHKRAMKLAELCGCSLVIQTTVATAVSEIARGAIDHGKNASLLLNINAVSGRKFLISIIKSDNDLTHKIADSLAYSRKLIEDVKVISQKGASQVVIRYPLNFGGIFSDSKINSIIEYFRKEPPLSPYDELRRKNQQLQDMAEKIKETENEYKILSDTLPLMMFSTNTRGIVTFANNWLNDFFGSTPKELSPSAWQNFIYAHDFSSFARDLGHAQAKQAAFTGQYRLKNKTSGNYLWHMLSVIPLKNEKDIISGWIGFIVDIHAQRLVEQTVRDNRELRDTQQQLFRNQEQLERKVVELNRSNYELEQFAHLASHDLQEPLRKLFFYSDVLKRKYSETIDNSGLTILNNMGAAAARMKELIQDLLSYSQLHKQKLLFEEVNLQEIFEEVRRDLEVNIREKDAILNIGSLPVIRGNQLRLRQLFTNLVSNSLKYSRKDVRPQIDVYCETNEQEVIVSVRDNGIGFDPQFSQKIFGLFERLHSRDEFPGTGIGLSTCKKIAELHGGRILATSKPDEYSLFDVYLPREIEETKETAQLTTTDEM